MYKGLEVQNHRITKLELARKRQLTIQLLQARITLDPEVSVADGSVKKLKQKLQEEVAATAAADDDEIDSTRRVTFENKKEDKVDYDNNNKAKAQNDLNFFQVCLNDIDDNGSDFDVRNVSDFE